MFLSLNFRYQKYGIKVLFYILGSIALFVAVMIGTHYSVVALLIFLLISFGFFFLAIFLSVKSKGTKRVAKNGKEKSIGEVISKSDRRIFAFFYKLEDGRIGKTTQKISKKAFEKINKTTFNSVPIIIHKHQAVLDQKLVEDDNYQLPEKTLSISSELNEIKDEFHIGSLLHGIIWYIFAFLSSFVLIAYAVYGSMYAFSAIILAPVIILIILNPITVIFFIIGAIVSRNYYYVKKITYEATKKNKDEEYQILDGVLIPLVNTEKKYEKFNKGSKIAIAYKGDDDQYHMTIQSVNGAKRAKLNDENTDKVKVYAWRKEDGKYCGVLGNKETSKLRKLINNVKQYNIAFFIMLAVNIYFFVTELISVIGSKFTSGLSNFGAIVYFMTITYVVGMFLLEKLCKDKKKSIYYAYAVTVIFLSLNVAILPGLYAFGGFNENVNFLVVIQGFFNTVFVSVLTTFIYLAYLFVKFINSIMKVHQAKELGEHYDRCLSYGDTISGLFTVLVFAAHSLITMFYLSYESGSSTTVITFQESKPVQVIFIIMLIAMTFFDVLFLIQCAIQMRRVSKNKKKEPKMALENKE